MTETIMTIAIVVLLVGSVIAVVSAVRNHKSALRSCEAERRYQEIFRPLAEAVGNWGWSGKDAWGSSGGFSFHLRNTRQGIWQCMMLDGEKLLASAEYNTRDSDPNTLWVKRLCDRVFSFGSLSPRDPEVDEPQTRPPAEVEATAPPEEWRHPAEPDTK